MKKIRTIVFTLGFDIKYQVKTIIDVGKEVDNFVIIISSDRNEKVIEAHKQLSKFIEDYLGASIETWEIDFSRTGEAFLELCRRFSSLREREVILDISGGMRIMGVLTLFAAIATLEPKDIRIYLWTEDGKNKADISFISYIVMRPIISDMAKKALTVIAEREQISLTELSNVLQKPKPSVYRAVKQLLALGIIEESKEGKTSVYRLNPKGTVIAYMSRE